MDRDVLRESIEENINSIFKHKKFETFINFIEGEGSVLACLARNPEGIMPSKISNKCLKSKSNKYLKYSLYKRLC